ncbi:MAG: hypothetical protein RJA98_1971 [Pseudomonadota bacterium]
MSLPEPLLRQNPRPHLRLKLHRSLPGLACATVLGALFSPAPAWAQKPYLCNSAAGQQAYWSDRACPSSSGLHQVPPPNPPLPRSTDTAFTRNQAYAPDAPPWYPHLSGACKSLNDALRTAYQRGLQADTRAGLQREWAQRCVEDEMNARRMLVGEVIGSVRTQQAARQEVAAQRDRDETHRQQCDEMLRIITAKRQRPDLTPGQRDDFERFQARYKDICPR